jgi:hypothetical protein
VNKRESTAILLGPGAERAVQAAPNKARALADEIRSALNEPEDSLAHAAVYHFELGEHSYNALPLPTSGVILIYRELSPEELKRQGRGLSARKGYLVIDLLLPTSAIFPRGKSES